MRTTILLSLLAAALLAGAARSQPRFLGNIYRGGIDPLFDTYWNQITPENSGKWASVEATRDQMLWSNLDVMFRYAEEHGFPVKHHTFVWGQQEPRWIAGLPPDEQRAEVEEWMAAFAERYPDVAMIDVVNEAQHAPPSYAGALGGAGETGWDWMVWAFERARELFPDALLLINDYNILCCERDLAVYEEQIAVLHERGLVDAIGVQAHGLNEVPTERIVRHLDRLAAFGLPIYISELDLSDHDDLEQLELYHRIFPTLWTHPAVEGVTLWGYKAGEMWLDGAYLIDWFDEPRPAMQWLQRYLEYDRLLHGGER